MVNKERKNVTDFTNGVHLRLSIAVKSGVIRIEQRENETDSRGFSQRRGYTIGKFRIL